MNTRPARQTLDTSLPKGVTARIGKHTRKEPRNILEQAALCDSRDSAVLILSHRLGLELFDDNLMRSNLSEPSRWARLSRETRLMEIGGWLRAECFELMDLREAPAISTVGD